MKNKTRTVYAMEALKEAMPKDNETNIDINEAYRQALEDMVAWIDIDTGEELTGHPTP